jgi:hypothetical protein
MRRVLIALTAFALLAAVCGDDDDAQTATDETTTTVEADDTTTSTSTTEGTTSTTATPTPAQTPGERIDIFPYEDAELAVVSVAADDVLNVRAAPGVSYEIVAELDPLADGIRATGHNRNLDDGSIWAEVEVDGTTGWANTAFLAQLGDTDDTTSRVYPDTADRPVADTMVQLGEEVARDVAGADADDVTIVVVDGPSVGDLGEITVDVTGFRDDSVLGERLRIFAVEEGGESFRLRTIEATTLCRRGVSDGLCV